MAAKSQINVPDYAQKAAEALELAARRNYVPDAERDVSIALVYAVLAVAQEINKASA